MEGRVISGEMTSNHSVSNICAIREFPSYAHTGRP